MTWFPLFVGPQPDEDSHATGRITLAILLAGSILTPWPAEALMPVARDQWREPVIETVQFRNNNQGGGFRGNDLFRSQIPEAPPVGRPPAGRPPGRPPGMPGGGTWGSGPVIFPDYGQRPRPPVVLDDDDDYIPRPPRRRPLPVIEEYDDEPVVRRRPQRRATPPAVVRAQPRPPIVRPPVEAARRPPPRLPPVFIPLASERRLVRDEVLVELRDGVSADTIARRHRLTALSTQRFTLANVTIVQFRVEGDRTVRQVLATMAGDTRIASAQPNFIYSLQQTPKPDEKPAGEAPLEPQGISAQPEGPSVPSTVPDVEPLPVVIAPAPTAAAVETATAVERKAQYSLGKMGIDAAHLISRGNRIRVVVIDTAVDEQHPELEGVVSRRFDAIGPEGTSNAGAVDNHGTAIAGAIIAKSALQGVSPAAELLVARAFTGGPVKAGSGAEGTTMHILKSLDWAHAEGARVVNLSFAGPQDRLLSRSLLSGSTKGMIAIAAAGNAGPNAAPLYPGADPSVIAVTATDADDKIFAQANTGNHVAVAAPGVDIIAAEPGRRYGFSSGTSMAAAHVSGLVALMLEKKADLDLVGVRAILSETALDLGSRGHDRVFGAGRIDAPAALARTLRVVIAPRP